MCKKIGTMCIASLLFLFSSPSIIAETSTSSSITTTTTTSDKFPVNEVQIDPNSTIKTIITKSTTTTTTTGDDSDAKIVDMIYKEYAKHSALNGTTLIVRCKNRVVEISGTVTMTSQLEEAVNVAKSVEGVNKVKSFINVITNQTKKQPPKEPNY